MKEKTKEFMKKYLIGFVLGVLTVGIIKVSAETFFPSNQVTYDNTESGLSSNDVQGAIDELYNTCFPPKTGGDNILEKVPIVTTGDGLYEDEYEEEKYIFKGKNPNNYVTFNGENAGWRIISIEPDNTIKLIRINSIKEEKRSNVSDYNSSSLRSYLTYTYYKSLNSYAQEQLVSGKFNIGEILYDEGTIKNYINAEKKLTITDKIGLISLSEVLKASIDTNQCNSIGYFNNYDCSNWLNSKEGCYWTLSAATDGENDGMLDVCTSFIGFPYGVINHIDDVRPVVYLSSDIKITGGTGTQSNPYQIE